MTFTECQPWARAAGHCTSILAASSRHPQEVGHLHFPDKKPSTCQPCITSSGSCGTPAGKSWGNQAHHICGSLISTDTQRQLTCKVGQHSWRGEGRGAGRGEGSQPGHQHGRERGGDKSPPQTLSRSHLDQLFYRETFHARLFIEETLQLSLQCFCFYVIFLCKGCSWSQSQRPGCKEQRQATSKKYHRGLPWWCSG